MEDKNDTSIYVVKYNDGHSKKEGSLSSLPKATKGVRSQRRGATTQLAKACSEQQQQQCSSMHAQAIYMLLHVYNIDITPPPRGGAVGVVFACPSSAQNFAFFILLLFCNLGMCLHMYRSFAMCFDNLC